MLRSVCVRPFVCNQPIALRAITHVRRTIPCRAASLSEVLITQSELIGKGLTLFVFFTSALNYLYYRSIREDVEKLNNKEETKDKIKGEGKDGGNL